ncbi:MAG: DUF3754 domain-containing protein [Actinomycetia bacterium]|nr:DUF3754 domain-containing protein [Actinomycetes bacterium]MCP4087571.1 DUF3754 domain-containing protein [Actinomycetes bacterium]
MADRERFVPQRVGDLTRDLCDLPWPEHSDGAEQFRAFSRLTAALYHYEFHDREQVITEAWDAIGQGGPSGDEAADAVATELSGLLDAANYEPVTAAELKDALDRESLLPLRLEVDLDDYDEVLIYRRGAHQETVEIPTYAGLRKNERTITVDERVVIHSRVKEPDWFRSHDRDPAERNLVPGHLSLKQFQNVPRADIEMLLPSTQVKFRLIDSLLIGVPAFVSGVAVLATKLLPTLGLIALLLGAWLGLREEQPELNQASMVILFGGTLTMAGFMFRQWAKLKNRKVEYLKILSENLYLRTLADGPGVFHTLLAAAEEQEVAEVLLAYRMLLAHPEGLTTAELDVSVEAYLRGTCHTDIDFDVDDGLGKLDRLGVVAKDVTRRLGRGTTTRFAALPLHHGLALLDQRWDDLFRHRPTDLVADSAPELLGDSGGRAPLIRLRRVVDRFRSRIGDRRTVREGEQESPD